MSKLWNLGSLLCCSNYSSVCGQFIIFPTSESGSTVCAGPGCGMGRVQDLLNTCTHIDEHTYNHQLTFQRRFHWADSLLGQSLSTCKTGNPSNCR